MLLYMLELSLSTLRSFVGHVDRGVIANLTDIKAATKSDSRVRIPLSFRGEFKILFIVYIIQ